MKVSKISYNDRVNFQGKNLSKFVRNFSEGNISSDTNTTELRELRNIYNQLWQELSLPENLKPRIQFKAMLSNMAFSIRDYMIYVEKRLSPFKMNTRNKSGKNKSILRHEIEHVMQIWEVIRLIGADNMANLFNESKNLNIQVTPNLLKKMREVEKTLGRITADSEEGKKAKQYLDAIKNYPDINTYYGPLSIKELKERYNYRNNLLEKNAKKEAKAYKPNITTTIKTMFKEFINQF